MEKKGENGMSDERSERREEEDEEKRNKEKLVDVDEKLSKGEERAKRTEVRKADEGEHERTHIRRNKC